ncbi:thioredoxin family protein [Flavobacterium sp.]|uniref:thioredoxin family protein n=1 Tax=Flavobacterium sp. TaxID=239 RepID=UPI0037532640
MRNLICLVIFILAIPKGFSQLNLSKFEEIDSLQKVEKRKVIVFIHTNWCKYCTAMQSKTFKNQLVQNEINERFYFISFDAEEKEKIIFNKNTFVFKPNGNNSGIHELAIELGTINKQINYPILCVLNDKNEIVFQHNSYLNSKQLIKILKTIK